MDDTTPELRVGDRERRAVDDELMAAVGDGVLTLAEYDERSARLWACRTRSELDALVADLPSHRPMPARPVSASGAPPAAHRVVAVMSEEKMAAPVLAGQEVSGYAVMGSVVLDLRRDDLPAEVRVLARAVMGEVEVLVPQDASVHLTGASVMGERKVEVEGGRGPVVLLDAVAVMGTVKVTHGAGRPLPSGGTIAPRTGARVQQQRLGLGLGKRIAAKLGGSLLTLALVGGAAGVVVSGTDGRAVFGSTVTTVTEGQAAVSVLFGSVQVVVPDGARVDTGGLVVFGSTDCEDACNGSGEGPVIDLRALGGFGSVEILTESEYEDGRG